MFGWLFKNKKASKNDLTDNKGNIIQESSVKYNKIGERFLKINDNECAIIIHPNNRVQVVFSKLYDQKTQKITPEQECLMAMGLFLKQPGFMEMLVNEFRRVASQNIKQFTEQQGEEK